jgi:uncharacterized membrane protein
VLGTDIPDVSDLRNGMFMNELTAAALQWLADHHGVITTAALRGAGVGRSTADRLVRAGVLRIAHKGVYVLTATKPTLEQRCVVLSAVHPTGYVTGPTAGALYLLRRMPPASALHFACRHGVHLPVEAGVTFRQTRALTAADRWTRPDGIIVARPRRLAFDLATDLSDLDHVSVVQQLLDRRLVTLPEVVAVGQRLCHAARPGSSRFRQSLHRLDRGAPAQSHPEVIVAEALWARSVPVERQARVIRSAGSVVHIDLAVPDIKWGIELDIHPEHRSLEGHRGDTRRYRDLHLVEWQVEPVSEEDLANVDGLADELAGLYHARRRQFAGYRSVS